MKSSIRPLGIITVSIFGFLIILTMYNNKSNFELTARDMQAQVITTNYLLDDAGMAKLDNVLLIDIREPHQYLLSHSAWAINIPLSSILDDENLKIWMKDQPKIIQSDDPVKAHEAWMLLTQMGVEQLFVYE